MGRLSKKMKYVEELNVGDCFEFEKNFYIKMVDFKQNGTRCCANLKTGCVRWINENSIVQINPIYTLDKDNNIIPMKVTNKENV